MSERVDRCQHKCCVYQAAFMVRFGPYPWLRLCPTHRNQFHVFELKDMVAEYAHAEPRRWRWAG